MLGKAHTAGADIIIGYHSGVWTGAFLLLLLVAAPVFGAWDRLLRIDGKTLTDVATSHSLTYFRASACGDLGSKDRTKRCRARTELHEIGVVGEFTLYGLDYYSLSEDRTEFFVAESILIEVSAAAFQELLFRGPFADLPKTTGFSVLPAVAAIFGGQTILEARTELGGNYHNFEIEHFLLTSAGFKIVDPAAIFAAAETKLPDNTRANAIRSSFDFASGTWNVCAVENNSNAPPKMSGCVGTIQVRFAIRNQQFVPLAVSYKPN